MSSVLNIGLAALCSETVVEKLTGEPCFSVETKEFIIID